MSCACTAISLGEMDKVVGMKIYAWDKMKGETLAHALVQFKNGKKGALHFHYNDVPKEEIPYFQIFGPKVSKLGEKEKKSKGLSARRKALYCL